MRLRHKKWAKDTIARHPDTALNLDNIDSLPSFNCLEIGSGKGRFLLNMAKNNPQNNYLGIEINYNAFSAAIKLSESDDFSKVSNYAFMNAPFQRVYEKIKQDSLEVIFLNFSDPWPRKREHKRRLTYPTLLKKYLLILKKGGIIAFKTDNDELYADSCEYFKSVEGLKIEFMDIYPQEDQDDVMTEFEEKFREAGKSIYRIVAKKR